MRGLAIWVVFCVCVPVFGAGWNPRGAIPIGSNVYDTGLVVSVLLEAGESPKDERGARGLEWLAAHQDREGGF
jgi:hypothetical protein